MSPERPSRLLPFLFQSMCTGIAVGWASLLAFIWSDISGIGTMIQASPHHDLLMVMLAVVFAITFGSVGMGIAVFLERDENTPPES